MGAAMDRRERPQPSDSGARMRAPLARLPAVLLTDAGSASAVMDAPVRAAAAGAATAPERQVWPTGPVRGRCPGKSVTPLERLNEEFSVGVLLTAMRLSLMEFSFPAFEL